MIFSFPITLCWRFRCDCNVCTFSKAFGRQVFVCYEVQIYFDFITHKMRERNLSKMGFLKFEMFKTRLSQKFLVCLGIFISKCGLAWMVTFRCYFQQDLSPSCAFKRVSRIGRHSDQPVCDLQSSSKPVRHSLLLRGNKHITEQRAQTVPTFTTNLGVLCRPP